MNQAPLRQRLSSLQGMLPFAVAWTAMVAVLVVAWWHSEHGNLSRQALTKAETAFRLQATYHMAMMETHRPSADPRAPATRGIARSYLWRAMDHGEITGRLITSRPDRRGTPDDWELAALARLKAGGDQVAAVVDEGGRPLLRFVGALRMEPSCTECHAGTGIPTGGVMGGISLAMAAPTRMGVLADPSRRSLLVAILAGWATILGGVGFARHRQRRSAEQAARAAASLRASEARLREAQKVAQMGSFEHDHRTGRIEWSEETYRLFGCDRDSAPPSYDAFMEHVHPEDRVRVAEEYNRHLTEAQPYRTEYRVVRADGGVRHLLVSCHTEFDAAGSPIRTLGVNLDLTERRKLDAALNAQAEAHRVLLETSIDGCLEVDEAGRVVQVNQAYLQLSGFRREDLLGRRARDLEATEDSGAVLARSSRVRRLGMDRYETWHAAADGRRVPLQVSVTYIPVQGRFLYFLRDLSAEQEARKALAQSEAKFAEAFRMSPETIILTNLADGRILDLNPGFESLSGWTRAEALGQSSLDLNLWGDLAARNAVVQQILDQGEAKAIRVPFRRKDGSLFLGEVRSVRIGTDLVPAALSVIRDVTELDRAESSLRASEARFRAIFDQASIGMALLDGAGRVQRANSSLAAFLQATEAELCGRTFRSCLQQEGEGPAEEPLQPKAGDAQITRPDGSRAWGRWRISPIQVAEGAAASHLGLVEDTTEARKRQAVTLESEAILAKGQMAAYVAHEINGPLAGISSALQLIQAAVPDDHPRRTYLDLARQEVQRIAGIVRSLYELHQVPQAGPGEARDVAVAAIMQEVAALMAARFRAQGVALRLDPGEPGLRAALRSDLLRQVLFNLLLNALDASPEQGTVHCTVCRQGEELELRIADQGRGIPEELRERVWEPGFTTKRNAVQGGLGMGLSTTRRLLESIQGAIRFEPQATGAGTVFVVRLPLISKARPEDPR